MASGPSSSSGYNPNAYTNLVASGASSNPFAQPQPLSGGMAPIQMLGGGAGGGYDAAGPSSSRALPAGTQLLDHDLLNQGSVYLPGGAQEMPRPAGKNKAQGKRATVIRKGNGMTWEDPTLIDWDPSECCHFCSLFLSISTIIVSLHIEYLQHAGHPAVLGV
jgi:hypothetical protein